MIDGIKIGIINYNKSHFLDNAKLDFKLAVNTVTGETNSIYFCKFRGLIITLKSDYFTEVKGSLHKFYRNGDNSGDFSFIDICAAIGELCEILQISPLRANLNNLEIGVNIVLPFAPSDLLERIISYRNQKLNTYDKGIGFYCNHFSQYEAKFYSKLLQGVTKENVFRFELRAKKMQKIGGRLNLYNLTEITTITRLSGYLMELINDLLIADLSIVETSLTNWERLIYKDGLNPNFWDKQVKTGNRKTTYKKKARFNKVILKYGSENHRQIVNDLLQTKISKLLKSGDNFTDIEKAKETTYKGHNYHLDKVKECHPLRICLVCGRDISSQAATSKFCSESLYGRDGKRCRNIYNNLKYKIKRIEDKGVLFNIREHVKTPSIPKN